MTTLRLLGLSAIMCTAGCVRYTRAPAVTYTPSVSSATVRDTIPGDSVEVLYASRQSGLNDPIRQVVRDSATFAALWRLAHYRQLTPAPPGPPRIDFTKDEVIIVAMGEQGSSSSRLQVRKVERNDSTGIVSVFIELHERLGCLESGGASSPAVMLRHRRSAGFLWFFHDQYTSTSPC